jgi:putative ABC transport system permease protein
MRRMFARVALLLGLGLAVGVAASLSAATLLRTILYGVDPRDPAILAAAALILIGVGLLAGLVPVYNVSRTDPADVLKEA